MLCIGSPIGLHEYAFVVNWTRDALAMSMRTKIESLLALDIIEPVNGPTPWVNAAAIVPKGNSDDIRLCIDMRRANEAIIRGRHLIPTVDEVLQSMNGSTVFSKMDLKWGYHQLKLSSESRDITSMFLLHLMASQA